MPSSIVHDYYYAMRLSYILFSVSYCVCLGFVFCKVVFTVFNHLFLTVCYYDFAGYIVELLNHLSAPQLVYHVCGISCHGKAHTVIPCW